MTNPVFHAGVDIQIADGTTATNPNRAKVDSSNQLAVADAAVLAAIVAAAITPPLNVQPVADAAHGSSIYFSGATGLGATKTAVKASAAGSLYGWKISNRLSGNAEAWVQIFDAATTGAVTLGSTAPTMVINLPPNANDDLVLPSGAHLLFANGIIIAVTTTPGGSTAPAANVVIDMFYK